MASCLESLLEEESSGAIINVPGSQVKHYEFGIHSAAHPDGYRFQIPNSDEFDTPIYLYH